MHVRLHIFRCMICMIQNHFRRLDIFLILFPCISISTGLGWQWRKYYICKYVLIILYEIGEKLISTKYFLVKIENKETYLFLYASPKFANAVWQTPRFCTPCTSFRFHSLDTWVSTWKLPFVRVGETTLARH